MSGVCLDCPGSFGCCVTTVRSALEHDEEERRTFREWCYEVGFDILMWTLVASVLTGIAGLCFYAGVWGFTSGIALLR